MSQCQFNVDLVCERCGYQARKANTRRTCHAMRSADESPGVVTLGVHYVSAIARWVAAGRPTRSQERINEILTTICDAKPVPCEKFKDGACSSCGCKINANPSALRNKLAMATEACPLGKWQAEP
jgi:hypothetical protein